MRSFIKWIIIILVITIGFLLYSRFVSTKGLNVKEYKVTNSIITDENHGLKIVHLSDLHYGSTIFDKELKLLTEKINEINPDIVVFTGDLFTENKAYDKDIIINNLKNINSKLGKFYISGNHDHPVEDYKEILNNSEFKDLDDNYELIYNGNRPIIISGISSNIKDDSQIDIKTSKLDTYLTTLTEDIYSILLIHEPDYIDKLNMDNYDLILSGHSHGGQVRLPLIGKIYTPKGSKKYYNEYYKINNTDLYISSGIGNSGANFRFFNHPSINFYRITNK